MTDDTQRVIGGIEGRLSEISDQIKTDHIESQEQFKGLFDKMNNIAINGCVVGRQNAFAITKLEAKPGVFLRICVALSVIFTGIGSFLIWLKSRT